MQANPVNTKFQFLPFFISIIITLGIGVVASFFTRPEIATWYVTLQKPSFTPPNWLFPVAWTILYILIGSSAYIVWKRRSSSPVYQLSAVVYIVQLALNFSWSVTFFGMHQILSGLVIIIALLIAIILNINWFSRISKTAACMLVPYLLWVSYATLLNLSIYILNE